MKDVTTRSFGLIIAYLLPGVACLCALAMWWQPCSDFLASCKASQANVGSFLFGVLLSLIAGLELNAIRWLVYEAWYLRRERLSSDYFVQLSEEDRLLAIHTAIDENFRYHQFYGSISLIMPVVSVALCLHVYTWLSACDCILLSAVGTWSVAFLCVVLESVTVYAAIASFRRYVGRSVAIMNGGEHAKRVQKDKCDGAEEGTASSSE